jgi:hypothetical protein
LVPIMMCENIGLSPCAWPSVADGSGGIEGGLGAGGNGGSYWVRWKPNRHNCAPCSFNALGEI